VSGRGHPELEYQFIGSESPYYPQCVRLRFEVFYRDSALDLDAAQDEYEARSHHLVAIRAGEVVGYIRLTLDGTTAHLTQFVVAPSMRGKLSLALTLYHRIVAHAAKAGAQRVVGEIRLPLTKAARRAGFTVSDETIPSRKTGIPHRRIELALPRSAYEGESWR
jgi:predicted GNAT family N-acyltransferase